jgi:hypothetical protein
MLWSARRQPCQSKEERSPPHERASGSSCIDAPKEHFLTRHGPTQTHPKAFVNMNAAGAASSSTLDIRRDSIPRSRLYARRSHLDKSRQAPTTPESVRARVTNPGAGLVPRRTWEVLSRLTVLMPRLESPDETDWATVANSLIPVARGTNLDGASRLRDRLVALAAEFPPKAATVDLTLLRRETHTLLDAAVRRHRQGWQVLDHLHARVLASVHQRPVRLNTGTGVPGRSRRPSDKICLTGYGTMEDPSLPSWCYAGSVASARQRSRWPSTLSVTQPRP